MSQGLLIWMVGFRLGSQRSFNKGIQSSRSSTKWWLQVTSFLLFFFFINLYIYSQYSSIQSIALWEKKSIALQKRSHPIGFLTLFVEHKMVNILQLLLILLLVLLHPGEVAGCNTRFPSGFGPKSNKCSGEGSTVANAPKCKCMGEVILCATHGKFYSHYFIKVESHGTKSLTQHFPSIVNIYQ